MICKICGKSFTDTAYMPPYNTICSSKCFHVDFWLEAVELYNNDTEHKYVSTDNKLYVIGDENSKSSFRGFGGSKVKIVFDDGTIKYSTNLWHKGDIPKRFQKDLPKNATLFWGESE